ncbi:MAG TPA: TlpA disulfide reductase family protein, partial [Candidatus Wallbacteria bacterium]|nr:TlpA disulfide reductase family protein [Candidatus Wallbacteria bacterium]
MKEKNNIDAGKIVWERFLKALISFCLFALFLAALIFSAPGRSMAARPLMGDPNAPREGSPAPAICVLEPGALKEVIISFDKPVKGGPGAPALVWFWFMSCENCVKDMKFMREIHKKYKSRLSLIAVNVDKPDQRGTVKNFIKNNGISGYDNYFDKITEH